MDVLAFEKIKVISNYLRFRRSTSTSAVGAPEFPGISSPLINLNGTVEVGLKIAWGASSTAWAPVGLVDLPESDVESTVGVVEHGVSISSTFVWDDAVAAVLVPAVFGAPSGDVGHVFSGTTWAAWASATWAVSTTSISQSEGEDQSEKDNKLHFYMIIIN